jgi:HSP20 family protein
MTGKAIEKRESTSLMPERIHQGAYYTPLVDIAETESAFIFQADLPGVRPEDLDVQFENGMLTIHGKIQEREHPEQEYLWREYGVGHFYRSFEINTPIQADGIKAQLRNGELTLELPKAASARARKIEIKGS